MKVYISASSFYKALGLKTIVQKRTKHRVMATWINEPELTPNRKLDADEKNDKAHRNLKDICDADVIVMMDDYDMVPGGKHFELGYAVALGKPVMVLGKREHLYCHLSVVTVCVELEDLIIALKAL